MKVRIAVLMGGTSAERDVSLASGIRITEALRKQGHDVVAVSAVSEASRDRAELLLPGAELVEPAEVCARATFVLIAVPDDALADLERRMEDAFDRELLRLAMRRVEQRVQPQTWRAFQIMAIENRTGAQAAQELKMSVAQVFVARHRVQKSLEEEVRLLKEKEG